MKLKNILRPNKIKITPGKYMNNHCLGILNWPPFSILRLWLHILSVVINFLFPKDFIGLVVNTFFLFFLFFYFFFFIFFLFFFFFFFFIFFYFYLYYFFCFVYFFVVFLLCFFLLQYMYVLIHVITMCYA
jgi:hypothetical protein